MDALADFSRFPFTQNGATRDVYRQGSGPAVVVMHEVPGITPQVARFARYVARAGFTVFMPHMFGTPGKELSVPYGAAQMARACIGREFAVLAENRASPITDWLRALARRAHEEIGGKGLGAIGMCLTGNFALTLALDPWVLAPVLSQPSLPLPITRRKAAAIHASPQTLAAVRARGAAEGLSVIGLRFAGDPICQQARFDTLASALGDAFEPHVLPDSAANPEGPKPVHSVLTTHLIDRDGEPTRQALERVIRFFVERLT